MKRNNTLLTRRNTKDFLRKLITLAIVFCLMPIGLMSQSAAALVTHINNFVPDPSVSVPDKLTATLNASQDTVIVTSNVTITALHTLNLSIPAGVTVDWRARYGGRIPRTGNDNPPLISLQGSGTFLVSEGGTILADRGNTSTSNSAIAADNPDNAQNAVTIVINGGRVQADSDFILSGGIVTGRNTSVKIRIHGGELTNIGNGAAIFANSFNEDIIITGGTLMNRGIQWPTIALYSRTTGTRNLTITGGAIINRAIPASATVGNAVAFASMPYTDIANLHVRITGGFILGGFSTGNVPLISNIVQIPLTAGSSSYDVGDSAMLVIWSRSTPVSLGDAHQGTITAGQDANLFAFPRGATATWANIGGKSGILYSSANGENTGFFELGGITVGHYTVTATVNNSPFGNVEIAKTTYYHEEAVSITATANDGYEFVNWTDQNGMVISTDAQYNFSATRHVILRANFKAVGRVFVSAGINIAEAGTVTGTGSYNTEEWVTLRAVFNEIGYEFVNWTDENGVEVSTEMTHIFMIGNEDKIFVANFKRKVYTVTLTSSDITKGRVGVPGRTGTTFQFEHGEIAVVSGTPLSGMIFCAWWNEDGHVTTAGSHRFVVEHDVELVGHFRMVFSFLFDPEDKPREAFVSVGIRPAGLNAGTVVGAGLYGPLLFPDTIYPVLTATANPGFEFVNWTNANGEELSKEEELKLTISAEGATTTVRFANFIQIHTIVFNSNGGSEINPDTVLIYNGEWLERPDDPTHSNDELTFGGWFTDLSFKTIWNFANPVESSMTLHARWIGLVCLVAFETNGGTKIDTLPVEQGDFLTEPVVSREGYLFLGWYMDEKFQTRWDFENDVVEGDMTLYARWQIRTYTVTFDSREGGSVVPSQTVSHGSTVERPSPDPTRPNFTFRGWYKDQIGIYEWSFNTDIIVANTILYARWQLGSSIAETTETAQTILQVYPNPVVSELRIVIPNEMRDLLANNTVELFDMTGKCVFFKRVTVETGRAPSLHGDTFTINMTPFPPGNYILRIGNHTAKIVKQ